MFFTTVRIVSYAVACPPKTEAIIVTNALKVRKNQTFKKT